MYMRVRVRMCVCGRSVRVRVRVRLDFTGDLWSVRVWTVRARVQPVTHLRPTAHPQSRNLYRYLQQQPRERIRKSENQKISY